MALAPPPPPLAKMVVEGELEELNHESPPDTLVPLFVDELAPPAPTLM
jgi:hypothetical protein